MAVIRIGQTAGLSSETQRSKRFLIFSVAKRAELAKTTLGVVFSVACCSAVPPSSSYAAFLMPARSAG